MARFKIGGLKVQDFGNFELSPMLELEYLNFGWGKINYHTKVLPH